jgi:hypothetical protein
MNLAASKVRQFHFTAPKIEVWSGITSIDEDLITRVTLPPVSLRSSRNRPSLGADRQLTDSIAAGGQALLPFEVMFVNPQASDLCFEGGPRNSKLGCCAGWSCDPASTLSKDGFDQVLFPLSVHESKPIAAFARPARFVLQPDFIYERSAKSAIAVPSRCGATAAP